MKTTIRELYKAKGYDVLPYGKIRGRWDGGRDLICTHRNGHYTVIVQCKYRECDSNASIDITDVYELFGAMKHYELQHKSEIVSGAFWTTVKGNNCQKAHEAAKDLGIAFYEGVFIYQQQ